MKTVDRMRVRRIVREVLREADEPAPVQAAGADIDMSKILDSVLTLARWDRLSAAFKIVSLNVKGRMAPAAYVKKNTLAYKCNLYPDKIYSVVFGVAGEIKDGMALLYIADSTGNNVATAKKKEARSGITVFTIDNFQTGAEAGGETEHYIAGNLSRPNVNLVGFEILEKDKPVPPKPTFGQKVKNLFKGD
jgi:hypothetical protein